MKAEVVTATPAHLDELMANLRPECLADLKASGWADLRALRDACVLTEMTAILLGGKVATIVGTTGNEAWVLSTTLPIQHPVEFLKVSKVFARAAMGTREKLTNYVHAAFRSSVSWLRWLGAEIGPPEPRGPAGDLFHRATLRRERL